MGLEDIKNWACNKFNNKSVCDYLEVEPIYAPNTLGHALQGKKYGIEFSIPVTKEMVDSAPDEMKPYIVTKNDSLTIDKSVPLSVLDKSGAIFHVGQKDPARGIGGTEPGIVLSDKTIPSSSYLMDKINHTDENIHDDVDGKIENVPITSYTPAKILDALNDFETRTSIKPEYTTATFTRQLDTRGNLVLMEGQKLGQDQWTKP